MQLIGKKEITLVHVAKSKLGLSEDEYRAALERVGVSSSKDLTPAKYRQLMDHFKACGFTPLSRKPRKNKDPKDKEPLLGKVGALRADLGLSEQYVNAMALRMFQIVQVAWLSPRQLHSLVAALEYHKKRQQRRRA